MQLKQLWKKRMLAQFFRISLCRNPFFKAANLGVLAFLATCKTTPDNLDGDFQASGLSNDKTAPYTYADYTRDCKKHLGEIPQYSCLDGVEVKLHNTLTGPITFENHKGVTQQCDTPTYIRSDNAAWAIDANHCVPGTRLGRLKPAKGFEDKVKIVFVCRRYFSRNDQGPRTSTGEVKFEKKITFDDTNVIAHNTETGATCFFVNRINRSNPKWTGDSGFDGRQVPRIGSKKGEKFWSSPEDMKVTANFFGVQACTECHDNDPFIHIPYNHNVTFPNGEKVVPEEPFGLYSLVGGWFFHRDEGTVTTQKAWAKLSHLTSPEASPCTDCHRIGSGASCSTFVDAAAGLTTTKFLTPYMKGKTWMPQDQDHWTLQKWEKDEKVDLSKTVKFIKTCCENRSAKGCQWEKIPSNPTVF